MAVTCSEESLRSLHMVNDQTAPGLTPIHTIAGRWPMVVCPVEVQLSRERALTLLEKHTLSAFRDIDGVSAAEIAENLGLFEPMLIEEALSTLQNSGALQSDIETREGGKPEDDLREELRLVEAKLGTSSFFGSSRRELNKKKKVLLGRIRGIESNRGGLRKRLQIAFERLRGYKARVTKSGLANLLNGKITEPQKKEVLSLIRSNPDGKVMTSRGNGFTETDLRPADNSLWSPVESNTDFNPVSNSDVETALRQSGQLQGGLAIQEIVSLTPSSEDLHIHLTMCVRHEDGSPEIVVHIERGGRSRSSGRLSWAEETINSNIAILEGVLREFRRVLPNATGAEINREQAFPLVLLPQYLTRQGNSNSRSPIVARNRKNLFEAKGSNAAFSPLLNSRTFIDLKPGKTGYSRIYLTTGDDLMQFEVSMSNPPLPATGSVAMIDGLISRGKVTVEIGNLSYEYPVLVRDKVKGQSIVFQISERLRSGMDSESAYSYTKREDDLQTWIDEIVSGFERDTDLFYGISKLQQATKGSGYNVNRMVTESLFSNKPELIAKYGAMGIFEELAVHESISTEDLWQFFEPRVQQNLLHQSIGSAASTHDWTTWIKHYSSEELLPWEDAAELEAALFGHCYHTKGRLVIRFESIVNELTIDSGVFPENLASNLSSLAQAGVIPEELVKPCFELKGERNDVSHDEDHFFGLASTQSAIELVRKLQNLAGGYGKDSRFLEPNPTSRGGPMGPDEMVDYLKASSKTIVSASQFGLSCRPDVWARVLKDGLPSEFSEIPESLLSALHDAPQLNGDLQFSSISNEIVNRAADSWLESMPESSRFELHDSATGTLVFLRGIGLEESAKSLGSKLAAKAPMPTGMSDLLDEVADHQNLEQLLPLSDLRLRWKRSVTAKDFTVSLDDLKTVKAKLMEPLGNVAQQLVKDTITSEIGDLDGGDAESVTDFIEKLGKLRKHWHTHLGSQDGYLSDRASQKIRKGNDLKAAAETLEGRIPVHEDIFPRTNESLRQIERSRKKKGES